MTMFVHETITGNVVDQLCVLCHTGVLLHYDDTSLQDIYFLDPQWLCDVLASVVTIREINSLAKSGLGRLYY